ncbi:MAG TPA: Fic family protein [Clostridiaceae bacterium]
MERHIVPLHDSVGRKIWYDSTEEMEALAEHIDSLNFDAIFKAANQRHKILVNKAFFQEAHYSALLDEIEFDNAHRIPMKYKNSLSSINYVLSNFSRDLDEDIVMKLYSLLSRNSLSKSITGMHNVESMIEFIDFYNYYVCSPLTKSCIIYYYFAKVHPLHDSSGRMGRQLALMYLLRNGYEFLKYYSLSQIMFQNHEELGKAFEFSGCTTGISELIETMLRSYSEGIDALAKMNYTGKKTVS